MLLKTHQVLIYGIFYILPFVFHTSIAFQSSNKDLTDNEAIIQLSVDSIHVVQTSDPRIANIEDNISDKQEKELLIALLTSYDQRINEEDDDNDSNDHDQNDGDADQFSRYAGVRISMRSASAWSSSIRFIPSSLNFNDQAISMPKTHSIMIINDDAEPLELYSLSGTNIQFYSSFFQQTVLPAHGGNTSIQIYFLPRTVGPINSTFTVKTNRGHFYYHVHGVGLFNPFRIYPIVNVVVPLNSTFEQILHLYNPYHHPLDVNEVYTSDENLIIELINNKNQKNKISKHFEHNDQWHLKPFEMKPIVRLNYIAHKLGLLNGFICVKTNFNDSIIIPVEINVSNRSGLYSYTDLLSFSPDRIVQSISAPITVPVYVTNNGQNGLIISDVRVTNKLKDFITVQTKKLHVPSDVHRANKIADLTIHPTLIPKEMDQIQGFVQVYTTSSSNQNESVLQIPLYSRILHGSLDFLNMETMFYINSNPHSSGIEERNPCQPIRLLNRFDVTLAVTNITVAQLGSLSEYVQIKLPTSIVYLPPKQWTELLCVKVRPLNPSSKPFLNIQGNLEIHTNLSSFNLLFHLYNGYIGIGIPTDHTNGGIRFLSKNLDLLIASVPLNSSRTVILMLANTNPVDIAFQRFEFTLPNTIIRLDYFESLDMNNKSKIIPNRIYTNGNLSQIVIPAQHQAFFSLTISGVGLPKFYDESFMFQTNHQTFRSRIQYTVIDGSLELATKTPIHMDVFPNRVGSVDIALHNKFDLPTNVTMMNFINYGNCFTFYWANTSIGEVIVESNKIQKIGRLTFDMIPLCNNIVNPSESTCYCGLNNHPEFKERWDDHVSALNSYELDQSLVIKFRHLWKEWTSLIRKQKIQTYVWLQTDRANISWPVSIGFVWPSVLEQMSTNLARAPIILDYHITLINMTKSHNIVVSNPSSNLVTYSVELINNYTSGKNENHSIDPKAPFSISTSSKHVRVINRVYQFELRPDEQVTFTVSYRPTGVGKDETYFVVRNNLTILESIWLRGEGGVGSLIFGDRPPSSGHLPLILEVNEQHASLCLNLNGNPRFQKIITLINTGNLNTIIHEILFGNQRCSGKGFLVETCTDIEVGPNEKFYLKILYQPDYTANEVYEVLILKTNIGLFTIPLLVRIPHSVLSACYKSIPRPLWELRTYCLCLCSLIVLIVLILSAALFDARRLYDGYLSRVEWRDRFQTIENKIFDLSDLSMAVQDEQKTRERIESDKSMKLPSTNTRAVKSVDLSNHEVKTKTNDPIPRRSSTSNTKNAGNHLKSMRSSETLNKADQSNPPGSKSPRIKVRRATLDNGQPTPSKPVQETRVKAQPARRAQPVTSSSRDSSNTLRAPTPTNALSSSAVSDEDTEPFRPARSRRASNKSKDSSSTATTVKSTPNPNELSPTMSISPSPPVLTAKRSIAAESSSGPSIKSKEVESNSSSKKSIKTVEIRTVPTDEPSSKPSPLVLPEKPKSSRGRRHKRKSLQVNQELFAQLTEQLRAAKLSTAETSYAMSIRSRCSSAPPSEHGGFDDDEDRRKFLLDFTSDFHHLPPSTQPQPQITDPEEDESVIEWDEPDRPDDDFGAYAAQTEQFCGLFNSLMENKAEENPISPLTLTNNSSKPVTSDNAEINSPAQHVPGPIQRPNKLAYSPTHQQKQSGFFVDSTQSPSTPDVLVQINHILHHQNSLQNLPPTPSVSSVNNPIASMSDLPTPNVPWTPFSSGDYDSSWPNMSNPSIPSNPFAQRQLSRDDASVWPSALGTATPRPVSTNREKAGPSALWNDVFPSASSNDPSKPATQTPLKFWPSPDSSSSESSASNTQDNNPNNPFWNPMNLNPSQPAPPGSWWPKTPTDDTDHDHSRWDFAR